MEVHETSYALEPIAMDFYLRIGRQCPDSTGFYTMMCDLSSITSPSHHHLRGVGKTSGFLGVNLDSLKVVSLHS